MHVQFKYFPVISTIIYLFALMVIEVYVHVKWKLRIKDFYSLFFVSSYFYAFLCVIRWYHLFPLSIFPKVIIPCKMNVFFEHPKARCKKLKGTGCVI